jgi:transposase-like protein
LVDTPKRAILALGGCATERKPYTRYSREFKLEAVRQAALGEKPKAQIARALGIRAEYDRLLLARAGYGVTGETKLESTVRCLGIEVDDVLEIEEQTEVQPYAAGHDRRT